MSVRLQQLDALPYKGWKINQVRLWTGDGLMASAGPRVVFGGATEVKDVRFERSSGDNTWKWERNKASEMARSFPRK